MTHSTRRALKRTVNPTIEPFESDDVKLHLKVENDDDDDLINGLICTAREFCEEYTRRSLIEQTWRISFDRAPGGSIPWWDGVRQMPSTPIAPNFIVLPRPPLISIESITSYDDSDVATVFAASNYYVDSDSVEGRVVLRSGSTWPTPARVANGLEIVFKAGYGTEPENIPSGLRDGMLKIIAEMYENRGEHVDMSVNRLPIDAAVLWRPHRIQRI